MIEFADDEVVPIKELVQLYESVGWMLYASDPDALAKAVDRSDYVVTARDADGELVGLTRCLTDDVAILYIQDVLVHPDRQREGIGAIMVGRCLRVYEHVRQKVLLTDDDEHQHAFYQALGFHKLADLGTSGLNTYVQIDGLELD